MFDEWEGGFWKLGRRPEVLQAGARYQTKGGGEATLASGICATAAAARIYYT